MSDFTLVTSNKRVKIVGCAFCRKNLQSDWTEHNKETCEKIQELECAFCKGKGHTANPQFCQRLADKIKRDEEREGKAKEHEKKMAEIVCNYCKERGHTIKFCPKIAEKNKKLEKLDADFPALIPVAGKKVEISKGWANIVTTNRKESVVAAVEKANEEQKKANEEQKRKQKEEKERKHAEYLVRLEEKKKRKEEEDSRYVNEMSERFGCHWFNFVEYYKDGEFDSTIAYKLRYDYEMEQEKREWEEEERVKKMMKELDERLEREEQEEEHNRKTMTPEQFNKWYWDKQEEIWDEDDSYFTGHLSAVGAYSSFAPPEYAKHAFITSQILNYKAKPLENRRLMAEWEKEKEKEKEKNKK
jgi:hypothetical protein